MQMIMLREYSVSDKRLTQLVIDGEKKIKTGRGHAVSLRSVDDEPEEVRNTTVVRSEKIRNDVGRNAGPAGR